MKIEKKFFQSKVARRIFFLFIISALIPIIFLSLFQIVQLHLQMKENTHLQIRQNVKSLGMELIGRLARFENQLSLIARAINNLPSAAEVKVKNIKEIAPDFSSITLVKNGVSSVLSGRLLQVPAVPSLIIGDSWMSAKPLLFVNKVNQDTLIVGEVMPRAIWDFDIRPEEIVWILDAKHNLLYSNNAISLPILNKGNHDSGTFEWQWEDAEYYVGYWSVFLHYQFHSGTWTILLAEPKSGFAAEIKNVYTMFIPTIVLALLISMLLSQAQIRRYLGPLEILRKATRRISERDFTKPVKINSEDEFEELSAAFNSMAAKLNQQFRTLAMLSELDQSIMASPDGKVILNLIFEGLKNIVNYDLLLLGVPRFQNEYSLHLLIDQEQKEALQDFASLDSHELQELHKGKEISFNATTAAFPRYLQHFNLKEIVHAVVFPVLHNKKLIALIAIGFKRLESLRECNIAELKEIFYRASVAFTHSEWEKRLYHQARFDDLTKLPNRLVLREQMHIAIERAKLNRQHCVLMYVDLDNFKDLNDTFGHATGDKVLADVARRLQLAVRGKGLVARVGGDEFTVLLSQLSTMEDAQRQATVLAENILKTLARPYKLTNLDFYASASIGIAIYPEDCVSRDELLKLADMSMYKAKEIGKNQYVFFSKELEQKVKAKNQLIQEMHTALQEDQFTLFFQPKLNSKTHALVGAEALIRWQHPEKGILLPDIFIPLAERTNLVFSIGEWAIESACQQLYFWRRKNYDISSLAINLAAKQFTRMDLAQTIEKILKKTGVSADLVEFEVTESVLIDNFKDTVTILDQIKHLGCRLAIDDFGTGYSSMHYLHMLPISTLKIDRVFMEGLPDNQKNLSIIKAVITLANSLKIDLIAEGIETKAQSELLTELGCVNQQGYFFSEPIPADLFTEKFLKKKT